MGQDEADAEARTRGVIWSRPERAAKGPVPSRSRQEVAAAAVALADAEGLEAVSMRRVAAALGIAATSLYGYVNSKDEIYDLMVDCVEGEDGPPPRLSGNWRSDLTDLAHRIRNTIRRHPWMASLAAGRPNFGPHSLAWTEHGLAAVDHLGLTTDEMLVASEILQAFVRGFVARELSEQQALQRAGLDAGEWARNITPYLKAAIQSGEYPRFARVFSDADLLHAEDRYGRLFSVGLDRILDGLIPGPAQDQ